MILPHRAKASKAGHLSSLHRSSCSVSNILLLSLISSIFNPALSQGLPSSNFGKYTHKKDSDKDKNDSADLSQTAGQLDKGASRKAASKAPAPGKRSVADAFASVELIESIISRVMNIPQVALTKTTGSQLLAQNIKHENNLQTQQSGQGVNYKLAIRPKEQGKVFASPSPSLQIASRAPQVELGYQSGAPLQAAAAPLRAAAAGGGGAAGQQAGALADDLIASADESNFENWRGNRLSKLALKTEGSVFKQQKPGVWDREESASKDSLAASDGDAGSYSNAGSSASGFSGSSSGPGINSGIRQSEAAWRNSASAKPSARSRLKNSDNVMPQSMPAGTLYVPAGETPARRVPDLNSAVGKFYKLNQQLEEAESAAEQKEQAQSSDLKAKARSVEAHARTAYNNTRSVQIFDQRPASRDLRESNEIASLPNQALLKRLKEDGAGKAAEKKAEYDGRSLGDKLAMLPPNVVTGIPLGNVSLGKSESIVVASLSQIGKLKQQKIRSWTVYTWSKKDKPADDALQLFFRHGQLDAIRVYDGTLIGADFGVTPGDPLERVKERFGEPSFLLPEPGAGSQKNYIYPISQVAFQLSRRAEATPQVVSVLIFSVK